MDELNKTRRIKPRAGLGIFAPPGTFVPGAYVSVSFSEMKFFTLKTASSCL